MLVVEIGLTDLTRRVATNLCFSQWDHTMNFTRSPTKGLLRVRFSVPWENKNKCTFNACAMRLNIETAWGSEASATSPLSVVK